MPPFSRLISTIYITQKSSSPLLTTRKETLSRFPQNPQLPISRSITSHIHPPTRIKIQPRRSKTPRTSHGPIARTTRNIRIPKHIRVPRVTRQRTGRFIRAISILRKRNSDNLESRRGTSIPRAVEGDVEGAECGIEFTVDGC